MRYSIFWLAILAILSSCAATEKIKTVNKVITQEQIVSGSSEVEHRNDLNIALLVPLNAQKAHSGTSLIQAAQLALEDAGNHEIHLTMINSDLIQTNPIVLKEKLKSNHIDLIIGPIFTQETATIMKSLEDSNITLLTLSNDNSLTANQSYGNKLLTLGVAPDTQAEALVKYAVGQGINNFHMLLPSTQYGKLIEDAIQEVIASKHNVHSRVIWYNKDNAEQVIDDLVLSLSGQGNLDGQAIFMPQGGANLTTLNDILTRHKLKIQLLGSQAWDHQMLLEYSSFEGALLVKNNLYDLKFNERFEKLFQHKPQYIDWIVYNAVIMVTKMHKDHLVLDKQSIIEHNKNFGSFANIAFNNEGNSLYNVAIAKIKNRKFELIFHDIVKE